MGDDESIRLRFPFSKRFLEYWKSRKEEEEGISLMKDRRKFTVGIGVIKLGLPRESRWKSVKEMQPTYEEGLYRRAVWYFLYIRYHSILGRLDRTNPTKTVKTSTNFPIERIRFFCPFFCSILYIDIRYYRHKCTREDLTKFRCSTIPEF